MAHARFTVFVVPDPRPGRPSRLTYATDPVTRPARAQRPEGTPAASRLGWRFLAANNRDVARSAVGFGGLATCIQAVRELQGRVADAVSVSTRTGRAEWTWRLRLDAVDVAVSSRTYQRRLQCEAACALFVSLVAGAVLDAPPSVLAAATHARARRTP